MSKVSIYLNPKASGANYEWAERIKSQLFRHDFELKMPTTKEELYLDLEDDLKNNVEYLFCIGGDGTVNTILQKIAGKNIKLLIIPGGTANDMAREVGMGRSLKNIIKAFQHKTHTKVDLIKINDQYMCTNGGIGCAADVAEKINSYRESMRGFLNVMKGVGSNIYPLLFTKEMVFGKMKQYNLHLESKDLPLLRPIVKSPLILVNNQSTLGGKFHVAPETKNTDGKFNVTIFLHETKRELLQCSYSLLTGNYPFHDKNLVSFETDRLVITNLEDEPLTFFGDGEILKRDQILEIEARPQALEVCSYMENLVYSNSYDLKQISLL